MNNYYRSILGMGVLGNQQDQMAIQHQNQMATQQSAIIGYHSNQLQNAQQSNALSQLQMSGGNLSHHYRISRTDYIQSYYYNNKIADKIFNDFEMKIADEWCFKISKILKPESQTLMWIKRIIAYYCAEKIAYQRLGIRLKYVNHIDLFEVIFDVLSIIKEIETGKIEVC